MKLHALIRTLCTGFLPVAAATASIFFSLLTPRVGLSAPPASASPPAPVKILCIGDSITQGGRQGREEYTYRWPLFCKLRDAGISVDFIGSRQAGLDPGATWPKEYKGLAFDPDHEGYYGFKTAAVRDRLKATLPSLEAPDVALIHLGTNDQNAPDLFEAVVKPLEDIIAQLRARNPKVAVYLGHLNFNGGAAVTIRPLVEDLATRLDTPGSPVVAVHHYRGWKENPQDPATDTFDWAHPNPQGQGKMADAWLAAMQPRLRGVPPQGTTAAVASAPAASTPSTVSTLSTSPAATTPPADHIDVGDVSQRGRRIQRTMRLLAESTPQKRHTVRILFYGQSITAQKWTQQVTDDLRKRFPHANILSENRALSGYSSQLLVRTAESDLYPFQPDLLIFHVYGAHDKYEEIIRTTRERTTAEILQQNDHLGAKDKLVEEQDPAKNPLDGARWNGFMNFNVLPRVSQTYQTELCDQRSIWKTYLTQHQLEPQALLNDAVHPNARGDKLMAAAVISYLRYDPKLGPSAAEAWVKDLVVGKDIAWKDGKLALDFEGSAVELLVAPGTETSPVEVRIDGRKPSELKELYGHGRARTKLGGPWPVIMPIRAEKQPLVEDWTMEVSKDAANEKLFHFTLAGSKTGPDGAGRSDQPFTSPSGRVVIEPASWGIAFPLTMSGTKVVPERLTITWSTVPYSVDTFTAPPVVDPSLETPVMLMHGLANAKHRLELNGDTARARIVGVRIHTPPLKR